MATILNLQVKDDTINNILPGNPFYVDIKGSVNICLIRCGQEIEACNNVNFSTMTNYGKILVLNPDPNKKSKCNIKLAFDTSNDNTNVNGDANYLFEKAFFTVPSLHKLNGQICDMETFLIFSSIQKNGNVLYVCLCTLSNGTNMVKNNDPKLLNYKLMNELFSKNNTVPEIFGTNQINGSPNPVDLSNFIPPEGLRNFYDYTHPNNSKVNFRIYQTQMAVSNDILNILKSKLTPGNIYQNFKNAIAQTINPPEGLFFYFSEDLTNMYKSYASNIDDGSKEKDKFENSADSIIEEQIAHENQQETEQKLKKIDIEQNGENEHDPIENNDFIEEKPETFDDKPNNINKTVTFIFFVITFLLIVNSLNTYLVNKFFTPSKNISQNDLPKYLSEITSTNMRQILGTKFKFCLNLFIQALVTGILICFLVIYIISNNSNETSNVLYSIIMFLLFIIFLNSGLSIYLNLNYFFYRLKSIYDDDFSQKEIFLFKEAREKIYASKSIYNLIKYTFSNDYTNLLRTTGQSGGGDEDKSEGEDESKDANVNTINAVPGSNNDNDKRIKIAMAKETCNNIKSFGGFINLLLMPILKEKFSENKRWQTNLYIYIGFMILFFIIGSLLDLKFLTVCDDTGINVLINLLISTVTYIPIIITFLTSIHIISKAGPLTIVVLVLSIIALLFGFLGVPFVKSKKLLNNPVFWIVIAIFIIIVLIIIVSYFIAKSRTKEGIEGEIGGKGEDENDGEGNMTKASAPSIEYLLMKDKFQEEREKRLLFQQAYEELKTGKMSESSENGVVDRNDENNATKIHTVTKVSEMDEIEKMKIKSNSNKQIILKLQNQLEYLSVEKKNWITEKTELTNEINKLNGEKTNIENQMKILNSEKEKLLQNIEHKNNQINALQEEINNIQTKLSKKNGELKDKNNSFKKSEQNMINQLHILEEQIKSLYKEYEDLEKSRENLLEELNIYYNKSNELEEKLNETTQLLAISKEKYEKYMLNNLKEILEEILKITTNIPAIIEEKDGLISALNELYQHIGKTNLIEGETSTKNKGEINLLSNIIKTTINELINSINNPTS